MARSALPCISCGGFVLPRRRRCPGCGCRVVDRRVWYIQFAPQIVGALMGMVYGFLMAWFILCVFLLPFWVFAPAVIYPFIAACTVAGAIDGSRRWDRMQDDVEDSMRDDKYYHDWRTEERCLAVGRRHVPVSSRQPRPGRCRRARL